MKLANRIQSLSGNVFAEMDKAKALARAQGKEIIDLSLGSSDLPVADHVIAKIEQSLHDPSTHGYLLYQGTQNFRKAVSKWYERKFSLPVDPETEVLQLIGSQEGTAHLPLAILNPGDFALLLDPGYPSHSGGVYLSGGQIYPMPLTAENNFLPVFSDIPEPVLAQAKLMVLSYPHNPTTAIAPLSFFKEAVAFCREHEIILVHDFPYVDLVFTENLTVPSILQADQKKEISIEFFTLSKSYNMGGFRIGYAIGNPELIKALRQIKAAVDFNQYQGILNGAISALEDSQASVSQTVATFKQRRDVFIQALRDIGWQVDLPPATMYVWAKLPTPWENKAKEFCLELIASTGVAVSPGSGFGKAGEGYVRFALVQDPPILQAAVKKIQAFLS